MSTSDIPDRFPPVKSDQLSTALCGEVILAYHPPDTGGIVLVYEDGRLMRFFVSPEGELGVHFNRLREEH